MSREGVTVVGEPVEATIEGVEGLVGTRDQETAEIQGSQPWTVDVADPDQVTAAAESAFLDDPAAVPDGMEILRGVDDCDGRRGDDRRRIHARRHDRERSRRAGHRPGGGAGAVAGATVEEAEAELADIGQASVELWPGWVTTVPTMDARVEVVIVDAEAQAP